VRLVILAVAVLDAWLCETSFSLLSPLSQKSNFIEPEKKSNEEKLTVQFYCGKAIFI
jgi:hypothetical protein